MSASSCRVQVQLENVNFHKEMGPTSCWMLIDFNEKTSVKMIEAQILKRFFANERRTLGVRLKLLNSWVPPWEKTSIFRENDIICVETFPIKDKPTDSGNQTPILSPKKLKEKCKRTHHDLEDNGDSPKRHKHKKHKTDEVETISEKARKQTRKKRKSGQTDSSDEESDSDKKHKSKSDENIVSAKERKKEHKKNKRQREIVTPRLEVSLSNDNVKEKKKHKEKHNTKEVNCSGADLHVESHQKLQNTQLGKSGNADVTFEINSVVKTSTPLLQDSSRQAIEQPLVDSVVEKPKRKRNRRRKNTTVATNDVVQTIPINPQPINLPKTVKPLRNIQSHKGKRVVFDSDSETDKVPTSNSLGHDDMGNSNHDNYAYQDPRQTTFENDQNHWQGGRGRQQKRGCTMFYEQTKGDQLNSVQTNRSTILQNTDNSAVEDAEQQQEVSQPAEDFTSFPLLQGPPRNGDLIAFKVLEMSEMYTPEVSEYQEGKVTNYDDVTKMLDILLVNPKFGRRTEGKFDLLVEYNTEILTNVDQTPSSSVVHHWPSLIEARLLS